MRRSVLPVLALVLATTTLAACGRDARSDTASGTDGASARDVPTIGTWVDPAAGEESLASLSLVRGRIDLPDGTERVTVRLEHARMVSLPSACEPSTVTRRRSYLDGTTLRCNVVADSRAVTFTAIAVGQSGQTVGGRVSLRGRATNRGRLPQRTIEGGPSTLQPDLRLVSSPDFLNADVGDLADGPGFWKDQPRAQRSANSTNAAYEKTLDTILGDWASLDPAGVLVAGDLVDGRWGYDDQDTGNFGPVDTLAHRRAAVRRAARTYYPQWAQRFTDHGLVPFPAMGDHEYGDNPWPLRKRQLATTFRSEFARQFTTDSSGKPLFADHPEGPAATSAYAGRPTPDVEIVTIDVFDITPQRDRIGLDPQQFEWLRGVLAKAKRDKVGFVMVQGHVPILTPVRTRGSSGLHYPGGADSRLWKLFRRYDVDLYLAGEVHDTTAREADGVVQITHGGLFQFGLTTALVLDLYGDALYVTLRDYDVHHSDGPGGTRLWETRRAGLPSRISARGRPVTLGTATVKDGRLVSPSGLLVPLD